MDSTTTVHDFTSAAHSASGSSSRSEFQPKLDSIAILQGHKSITIQHNGSLYRLQATKLGKLILTK